MPTRSKVRRSTAKRHTVAVAARPSRPVRKVRESKPIKREIRRDARVIAPPTSRKTTPFPEAAPAHVPGPGHAFVKAMKYLDTLTDFERLRIVRYNTQNFDLDRMRTLLKKLGNPHEEFKSIHVAGTKGKGSTCAMIASMLH